MFNELTVIRGSNQTLRTKSSSVQLCYFLINPCERTRGLWKSLRWWRKTKRSEEKSLCASKQNIFSSIISVVRFRQTKTQMKSWVGFSICRFIHIINSLIYSHNTSLLDMWPLFLKRTGHRYNKRSPWHSLPSKPAIPLDVGFYCMTAINIAVDTTQLNQSKKKQSRIKLTLVKLVIVYKL